MNRKKALAVSWCLALLLGVGCTASDDNQAVQEAMKQYVNRVIGDDGIMPLIHEGRVLQLEVQASEKYPDGFHQGVKNHGQLFTSCADFVDPSTGRLFDIDFLVKKTKGGYEVVQPIVHSIDGSKNPYDLEH